MNFVKLCPHCKDLRIVKKPSYASQESNSFRCIQCRTKIFVSKIDMRNYNYLMEEMIPNELKILVLRKQDDFLRSQNEDRK